MSTWSHHQAAAWQQDRAVALATWRGTVDVTTDLVCRHCYQQGTWSFLYAPLYRALGRSAVPMLAACPCGGVLTIEEAVALRTINGQLAECFPMKGTP